MAKYKKFEFRGKKGNKGGRPTSQMSHAESRNFKTQKHREIAEYLEDDIDDYLGDHQY